jgi:hypothetical protein
MASNFRIIYRGNSDHHHLKLVGDFDGSSAYELINVLKAHDREASNFLIHTGDLSSIHPFGIDVFRKNQIVRNMSERLTFTGTYGNKMALAKSNWI